MTLDLAVVSKTDRDDCQQNFSCMRNKRNPSVVVAISWVLHFVKDLDDRIFPLLGDFSRYPHIDKDVVKALDDFGVVEV